MCGKYEDHDHDHQRDLHHGTLFSNQKQNLEQQQICEEPEKKQTSNHKI